MLDSAEQREAAVPAFGRAVFREYWLAWQKAIVADLVERGHLDLAAEIVEEVDAPNLGLQFDVYHAQMIHGDALAVWQRHAGRVRHVQIADWPSRHEPRQGDIDLAGLFRAIDIAGYRGWVGAEYTPRSSTEAGLRWLRPA